jgi:hypothetical protein
MAPHPDKVKLLFGPYHPLPLKRGTGRRASTGLRRGHHRLERRPHPLGALPGAGLPRGRLGYYCWRGKEIPRTVFEIAVSDGPLTAAEMGVTFLVLGGMSFACAGLVGQLLGDVAEPWRLLMLVVWGATPFVSGLLPIEAPQKAGEVGGRSGDLPRARLDRRGSRAPARGRLILSFRVGARNDSG